MSMDFLFCGDCLMELDSVRGGGERGYLENDFGGCSGNSTCDGC